MSGLSRKAFEAAVLRDWPAANLNRCPSVSSRAGQYADEIIQRAWWGWQASREALVIELPSEEPGYMYYAPDVVAAIEAAGLKVSQ